MRTSRSAGAQPAEPLPHRGVDRLQRAVKTLGVVSVAVDLVGLDEVGEHEPVLELVDQPADLGQRRGVGRAGMLDVDPGAGEQLPGLADGVHRHPGGLQLGEIARARRLERQVEAAAATG